MKRIAHVLVVLLLALTLALPATARHHRRHQRRHPDIYFFRISEIDMRPPAPTTRCNDGTFSLIQYHQGPCSHHGGVAEWLK